MKDIGLKKVDGIVSRLVLAALTVAAALIVSAMAVVLIAACFRAEAAETNAPVVAETLLEDGTTNTWTQAELIAALGLINRRYRRDIETEKGRTAWHGKVTRREVVTNDVNIIMRTTYEDGFVYDEEGKPPQIVVPKVRTIPAYMTNDVPARLAAARIAAFNAVKTVTTNVTLTVGDVLRKPLYITRYNSWGDVTNVVTGGTIEREVTPTGMVTRIINSDGEIATQRFVPNAKGKE